MKVVRSGNSNQLDVSGRLVKEVIKGQVMKNFIRCAKEFGVYSV